MKLSYWPLGDYPIYINPTDKDLIELMETNPDTIRICDDTGILAIASGFGNTHNSISKIVKEQVNKGFCPMCFILFRQDQTWWWNLEDVSGSSRVSFKSGLRYLDKESKTILEGLPDLVMN